MKAQFEMLADYNAWVNRRLYDAADHLADADYRADTGAFFGSLHGTLNHLLVGDLVWMNRFTASGRLPQRLDEILFVQFKELRLAREAEDARIINYIRGLTDEALLGSVVYRSTRSPVEIEQELAPLLVHFFNHQTHHRGQAHAILTMLANEAPSFDLLMFQRETGIGIVRGQGGALGASERRPST